jgi:hypothetical protein
MNDASPRFAEAQAGAALLSSTEEGAASLTALTRRAGELSIWFTEEGLRGATAGELFEGYCRRLSAMDFVIMRTYVSTQTLHPQWTGYGYGALTRTEFGPAQFGSPSWCSGRGGGSPRPERFVSEDAKRSAGGEMALDVECVVGGGVNGQETLGGSGRFETLHLALASSCRLMRILSPIVPAQTLVVASRQSDFGLCRTVRPQLVGHQHIGREALFLEQLAHQFHRCSLVAPSLHEQVENLAFVINRAPEPELPARDRHGHLHRDATERLAEGVDAEALGRTMARTSIPIAVPFRRRCPDRTPRADLRRRDS